jgi:hypothetical protein
VRAGDAANQDFDDALPFCVPLRPCPSSVTTAREPAGKGQGCRDMR